MTILMLILVFQLSRQAAAIVSAPAAVLSSPQQTLSAPAQKPVVVLDSGHEGIYFRPKNTDSEWPFFCKILAKFVISSVLIRRFMIDLSLRNIERQAYFYERTDVNLVDV